MPSIPVQTSLTPPHADPAADLAGIIRDLEEHTDDATLARAIDRLRSELGVHLLATIVASCVRRSHIALARRLLGSIHVEEPAMVAVLSELRTALDPLPDGREDPATSTARLRRNLEAMRRVLPTSVDADAMAAMIEQAAADLDVHRCDPDGQMLVARRTTKGLAGLVWPLDTWRPPADILPTEIQRTTSLAFAATPHPRLLAAALQTREPTTGFEPPVTIVDTDAYRVAALLASQDVSDAIDAERLTVFAGPDAEAAFEATWEAEPIRILPTILVATGLESRVDLLKAIERLAVVRASQRRADVDEIRRVYAARGGTDHAARAARCLTAEPRDDSTPALRVAGIVTRHSTVVQFQMESILHGFRALGCETECLTERTPHHAAIDVPGRLRRGDIDLLLAINHSRVDFGDVIPTQLPLVSLFQDYSHGLTVGREALGCHDHDLLIVPNPEQFIGEDTLSERSLIRFPNIANPLRFGHHDALADPIEPIDVFYAGHGAETAAEWIDAQHFGDPRLSDALHQIRRRAEMRTAAEWFTAPELVRLVSEIMDDVGLDVPDAWFRSALPPATRIVMDRVFRHQMLEWVAQWADADGRTFALYGRGWERHPTLARFARGVIAYGEDLSRRAQQSVAVHAMANGALHQRLFDGFLAGGRVLVRDHPSDWLPVVTAEWLTEATRLHVSDSADLARVRPANPDFDQLTSRLERLLGFPLTPEHIGSRADQTTRRAMSRWGGFDRFLRHDDPVVALRCGDTFISSGAMSIDGLDQFIFRTDTELHGLLTRYCDDQTWRADERQRVADSIGRQFGPQALARSVLERLVANAP